MPDKKSEFKYEVKLDWGKIRGISDTTLSPYERFYYTCLVDSVLNDQIINLLYFNEDDNPMYKFKKIMHMFKVDVSNFYICKKDEDKLDKYQLEWILKKKRQMNKKLAKERVLPFDKMAYGPAVFTRRPRWAKEGYAYIKPIRRRNGEEEV